MMSSDAELQTIRNIFSLEITSEVENVGQNHFYTQIDYQSQLSDTIFFSLTITEHTVSHDFKGREG